jgi:ribose transport system substrate-binding protein
MSESETRNSKGGPRGRSRSYGAAGLVVLLVFVVGIALTACGGGGSSSDTGGATEATAEESTGGESTGGESGSSSSPIVAEAKELVKELESTTTKWGGPTTGPKASPGKSIVVITCTSNDPICVEVGESVEEVGGKIGWNVTVVSGNKGTQQEVTEAWNQALALKPDGIVNVATDATANKKSILEAKKLGIPVVGVLSTGEAGPAEDVNEFSNVSQDPGEIGKALVMLAIAESNGEAKVAIDGVAGYAIAEEKTDEMKKVLAKCEGCEELAYNGADLSAFETETPQLISGWVSKFGPEFWILTVADAFVTPMVTPLRQGGVPPDGIKIAASDGSPEAYERIRNGEYQVATIPQAPTQLSFQAVDELNRAFNGQPSSGFAQPLHIVSKANVEENGGANNEYIGTVGFEKQYEEIWSGK